jgi:multidrug efflux pump subunit AcrA (membrane-fusion protein)
LLLFPAKIEDRTITELISGRVIPKNQTQLLAEVQGQMLSGPVAFKPGVRFRKGDTLIAIDSREYSLTLFSQKSAFLNSLTGIMPDLKSDFADSYEKWKSYLDRFTIEGKIPDLPTAKSDAERFFVVSRGIYTAYYGIKAQEERLGKYRILAPFDGVITQALLDVGGIVSPGQPLGVISSSSEFELETGASLATTAGLKIGDRISFTSNEQAGDWTGTLVRIGGAVDPKTQLVPLFFRIEGKGLLPGMYLQGSVGAVRITQTALIPSRLLGRDNQVLVLAEGLILSRPVEPVRILGDSVFVTGLAAGEELILNKFSGPIAGKKVIQP